MKEFFKKRLQKILMAERSVHKLAFSSAAGMAVAFSPFLGLQTLILFGLGALLRLNIAVAMIVLYLVNNPLTMFPILIFDYIAGVWFSSHILKLQITTSSPQWLQWFIDKISCALHKCGIVQIDLWGFVIGGTIIALLIGVISYPLLRLFYAYIIKKFPVEN